MAKRKAPNEILPFWLPTGKDSENVTFTPRLEWELAEQALLEESPSRNQLQRIPKARRSCSACLRKKKNIKLCLYQID